jgi:hypothetical protein
MEKNEAINNAFNVERDLFDAAMQVSNNNATVAAMRANSMAVLIASGQDLEKIWEDFQEMKEQSFTDDEPQQFSGLKTQPGGVGGSAPAGTTDADLGGQE